jgi:NADPH:quinone reductase-like Zn-dependent oxidoreductase
MIEAIPIERVRQVMKNRKVVVTAFGSPSVLKIVESDLPRLPSGFVRVRILAAGVSYADLLMREGVHPETPPVPFTPGFDFVGRIVDRGNCATDLADGQTVAGLPIFGTNAQFIDIRPTELVPVPPALDPAEALCVVFNYMTSYQMMVRSAHVQPSQQILVHSAAGGIGTALLQLGRLMHLEMYGTASPTKHDLVRGLGCIPINYKQTDFVAEIQRLTSDGVDVVFDGIGGSHLWRSYQALRTGGQVISYGLTSSLQDGQRGDRQRGRLSGLPLIAFCIARSYLSLEQRRIKLYSIQNLRRLHPDWFNTDLQNLLDLLGKREIQPIIAERIALDDVVQAHEKLGRGQTIGKIVIDLAE